MDRRNWIALTLLTLGVLMLCVAVWVVFVDPNEPPGATGSISGAPSQGQPATPETPGQSQR